MMCVGRLLFVWWVSTSSLIVSALSLICDKEIVHQQLGYLPKNFKRVSARLLSDGTTPVAIRTHPMHGGSRKRQAKATSKELLNSQLGTPFPTLYWLTCPEISAAIADLERQGHVKLLEERLNSDPTCAQQFMKCHEKYAKDRWESLTKEQRHVLEQENNPSVGRMRQMLQHSGIAGTDYVAQMQNDGGSFVASIKCLHAHYAHYRSVLYVSSQNSDYSNNHAINPAGYWTHQLLLEQYPHLDL